MFCSHALLGNTYIFRSQAERKMYDPLMLMAQQLEAAIRVWELVVQVLGWAARESG